MGFSVTLYLRMNRLKQAWILLEGSFLRVIEVAAHVGIIDLSHFVRDYKALYGQTHSQTRALLTGSGLPIKRSRFRQ
jgi:transcriptional regulator GlxA family with amidase domain